MYNFHFVLIYRFNGPECSIKELCITRLTIGNSFARVLNFRAGEHIFFHPRTECFIILQLISLAWLAGIEYIYIIMPMTSNVGHLTVCFPEDGSSWRWKYMGIIWCLLEFTSSWYQTPHIKTYRRPKWTLRYEFKSWTRLIAFHIVLKLLCKICVQLFSFHPWATNRADWARWLWYGNRSRGRNSLNSNPLDFA